VLPHVQQNTPTPQMMAEGTSALAVDSSKLTKGQIRERVTDNTQHAYRSQ
jgi:hypothetical protein